MTGHGLFFLFQKLRTSTESGSPAEAVALNTEKQTLFGGGWHTAEVTTQWFVRFPRGGFAWTGSLSCEHFTQQAYFARRPGMPHALIDILC
jgi:hypothetical protein